MREQKIEYWFTWPKLKRVYTPLQRAARVVARERRKLLRMSSGGRCRPRRLKRQAMLVQKREIRLLKVRDAG